MFLYVAKKHVIGVSLYFEKHTTVDFSTMVSIIGSSNEDIIEILKTIIKYIPEKYLTDGKIDTSKITMDDFLSLKKNIGGIVPVVFQVINSNNKLKKTVIDSMIAPLLLILSLIALVILMILLNKYLRVKYKTENSAL